jgi:hypothetical protein
MRSLWRYLLVVGALMAGALLLAACGGGEEGAEAETPEDYVRSFCEAFEKHAEDLRTTVRTDWDEVEDIEAGRGIMSDAKKVFEDLAKDLDKIDPPNDIEETHEGMVSAFFDSADVLDEMEQIFDKPLAEAMEEVEALEPRLEKMGEAFEGLEEFPAEYRDLLESDPKCKEVEDIFEEGS